MRVPYKQRYETMRDSVVIDSAKAFAHWTLPQLMAMADQDIAAEHQRYSVERDYQEVGALLVNNLAAKLVQLMFPMQRPFFNTTLPHQLMRRAMMGHDKTEIEANLARMTMDASQALVGNASYAQLLLAAKYLIVTGNVLTYRDTKAHQTTAYGLSQFVGQRDGRGEVQEIILREHTYFEALSPQLQTELRQANPTKYGRPDPGGKRKRVEMFTRIVRASSRTGAVIWRVSQEIDVIPVGEPAQYPEHLCPWQWITWNLIPGEHYGRGHVEDYSGGFAKLSDLSEAAALYGIEMTKIVHLVAKGQGTDIDALNDAEHGEYVSGSNGSVEAYEAGDAGKLQAVRAEIVSVSQNLSRAFMYTGEVRDSERTTAYEIAQMQQEAEQTLGGTVAALSQHWQTPLAHILLTEIEPGILAGLITKRVRLEVAAGWAAMARSVKVQLLLRAVSEIGATMETLLTFDDRIDRYKVLDMIYAGQGIDAQSLFKSPAQLAAEKRAKEAEAAAVDSVQQTQSLAERQDVINQIQQGA
ncbi:putative collar protein [Achromobacter phage vB_AxyP_19-32_Axy21]|uniref:Putative collar protein n=1 Tax=Achromobacter phage vB_AxyP_19-32_Axy21 TaxID=2591045 RepID=A0A514CVN0_9CAUD|nr:putative collar protein [Achromobacter phage vB_AxyP_19-32_Axy21]